MRRQNTPSLVALAAALAAWAAFPGPGFCPEDGPDARPRLPDELFPDPNRSPARHLVLLPRVGPTRATAIVAERTRGPYRRLSDLARVHGIGPHTLAGMKGVIAVRGAYP